MPKMNIQGNHGCIRKFVLLTLPDIYKSIQEGIIDFPESASMDKDAVNGAKIKLPGDSAYSCDTCSKTYVRKSAYDKHIQLKHAASIILKETPVKAVVRKVPALKTQYAIFTWHLQEVNFSFCLTDLFHAFPYSN